MKILSLTVENWRSITYTTISYHNLLIVIGESNSGKSSLLSAVSFFFNPYYDYIHNLKDQNEHFEISVSYIDDRDVKSKLSIYKGVSDSELSYYIQKDHTKKELTIKEFHNLLGHITLLEISSYSRIPQHTAQLFIKKIITFLEKICPECEKNLVFLHELYNDISNQHVNKPISRHILFKSIKYLHSFLKKNKIEKVERLFIVLENPELFLNPHEEREFFDYLIKLSNIGVHIILETHSSRFVGLKQYPSITIAKSLRGESSFFQYHGKLFSGDEIKNFNMNYWINTDRSELFFAKKVILVEGQTDKMVINYLGKALDAFKYDYCVIECGSKSLIPQFSKLCNSFKIPYVAVYDKDNHLWRNEVEIENSNRKNHQIQKSIDYSIGHYVEFSNDIEEEIFDYHNVRKPQGKNKPFIALKTIMEDNFSIPQNLKNKLKKIWN